MWSCLRLIESTESDFRRSWRPILSCILTTRSTSFRRVRGLTSRRRISNPTCGSLNCAVQFSDRAFKTLQLSTIWLSLGYIVTASRYYIWTPCQVGSGERAAEILHRCYLFAILSSPYIEHRRIICFYFVCVQLRTACLCRKPNTDTELTCISPETLECEGQSNDLMYCRPLRPQNGI